MKRHLFVRPNYVFSPIPQQWTGQAISLFAARTQQTSRRVTASARNEKKNNNNATSGHDVVSFPLKRRFGWRRLRFRRSADGHCVMMVTRTRWLRPIRRADHNHRLNGAGNARCLAKVASRRHLAIHQTFLLGITEFFSLLSSSSWAKKSTGTARLLFYKVVSSFCKPFYIPRSILGLSNERLCSFNSLALT